MISNAWSNGCNCPTRTVVYQGNRFRGVTHVVFRFHSSRRQQSFRHCRHSFSVKHRIKVPSTLISLIHRHLARRQLTRLRTLRRGAAPWYVRLTMRLVYAPLLPWPPSAPPLPCPPSYCTPPPSDTCAEFPWSYHRPLTKSLILSSGLLRLN